MSEITTKQLIQLVSRAVREASILEQFLDSPRLAARSLGIELEAADAAKLRRIATDLKRFAGHSGISNKDARHWTVGLLHVTEFLPRKRAKKKSWKVSVMHVEQFKRRRAHKRRRSPQTSSRLRTRTLT